MTSKLVYRGWGNVISDALSTDSSHVRIISPFIKESAIKNLLAHKPHKLQVITRFNLADFSAGVSDVAALRELNQADAQVRGIKNLHAKLYVFGSTRAVVTSANLTHAGLNRNFELGVVSDDLGFVRACQDYFDNKLWKKAGKDVTDRQISGWAVRVEKHRLRGGGAHDTGGLDDYGVDVPGATETPTGVESIYGTAKQAFVKFLGRGTKRHRAELSDLVIEVIKSSECHWALSQSKRPRQVQDGAVIYIGQFTQAPDDIRVFGRAIGIKHVPIRDDATQEDIDRISWRVDYPHYTKVHHAEFVAGTLANGVSLNELMRSKKHDSFASTQRNYEQNSGKNTNPRHAYSQHARVELASAGQEWLEQHLNESFETHGTISTRELANLYWPDSV